MTKYTKKPVTIEAFQLCKDYDKSCPNPEWFTKALLEGDAKRNDDKTISLKTHQGWVVANIGDYVIQQTDGEIYPCKPDIFEATYDMGYAKEFPEEMKFGDAIEAMKQGLKVARKGWNGSGMFAYYVPENKYPASRNEHGTMVGVFPDDMVPYRHYLALKTAQGDVATWAPSCSDALAEDWQIVQ